MSSQLLFVKPVLAQTEASQTPAPEPVPPAGGFSLPAKIFLSTTILLAIGAIALVVYGKLEFKKRDKALKFEKFKTRELQKKLKFAVNTIKKMEANPDLIHSREFNLDYLRLRMEDEVFHFAIVNHIKMKVKNLIGSALRPDTKESTVGIANTSGRQIDEKFDVTYDTVTRSGKRQKGVLFRIQIKLTKLPTQSTSTTINQIIDCIEKFLMPEENHENWYPTIQGRIVTMEWDQKAKPTPLLVLEQSTEGGGVTLNPKWGGNTRKSSAKP
ncbi:MAG: hypothetical protein SAJ37_15390 [Oscillatoria sp. PMC 1068.18]|nr:hypothetical protein [Oscillatoria sp. PMC 1076.18]MEC4990116.1 hypothetical protein [Oscillatoria sp. PMC 1068.18]